MYGQNFKQYRELNGLSQEATVARLRALGHRITLDRYRRIKMDQSALYLRDVAMAAKVFHLCPGTLLGDCPTAKMFDRL